MTVQSPTPAKDTMSPWHSVSLVFELGYIIALPAVLLGFGGAYLDQYLGWSPLFTFLGFVIAFALSTFIVIRKVQSLMTVSFTK